MALNNELCEKTLVALRKIMRAVDIHSKKLVQSHQLTGPQLILLREISRTGEIAIGELARRVHLGNATTTGIVDRLELRGLLSRSRNGRDRRNVLIKCTDSGLQLLDAAPPLLQEQFINKLESLEERERVEILSSLTRVASMMDADHIDAAPVLANHPLDTQEDALHPEKTPAPLRGSGPSPESTDRDCLLEIRGINELPSDLSMEALVTFLFESLKPFNDTKEDIKRGIEHAICGGNGGGGFVLLSYRDGSLVGSLVMLNTGMQGYIPQNLLLFVAVAPSMRGQGLGRRLVEHALSLVDGEVKLHVEYDNPAKRLYERIGFTSKYAEMRYCHESASD